MYAKHVINLCALSTHYLTIYYQPTVNVSSSSGFNLSWNKERESKKDVWHCTHFFVAHASGRLSHPGLLTPVYHFLLLRVVLKFPFLKALRVVTTEWLVLCSFHTLNTLCNFLILAPQCRRSETRDILWFVECHSNRCWCNNSLFWRIFTLAVLDIELLLIP